jgi:lactate dehydrogenase-like 2-hydroxyacid dehydrogenase
MQNVKAICLQTTSFSWIDVKHAKDKGIPVTNLRGFSSEAVAEFALTLAFGVARKLPLVAQANYQQDFVKHEGIELKGKTAGIIGLGRIGSNIASLTKGIGMRTLYWSQNSRNSDFEYCELSELLSTADVVFLSLAQNNATESILTPELIRTMRPSTIFVSTTHQIYDHDLMIKMVQEGQLYGYGYEKDNGNPKDIAGNIYCLPAIAWATEESLEANVLMWTDSIISAEQGEYPNQIN